MSQRRVGSRTVGSRRPPSLALAAIALVVAVAASGCSLRNIVFPVAGNVSYVDTFGAPRSGGRTHEGQDLMGVKHTPVVAAVDGTITALTWSTSGLSGNSLTITDEDGWHYVYIHLNNDQFGTDDGSNVYGRAFADGIAKGQRVKAGEIIGYLGDSGNAEDAGSHLHFELRTPDNVAVNAYGTLLAAVHVVRTEQQRIADSPFGRVDFITRDGGTVRTGGWTIDAHVNDPVRIVVYVNGNPVANAVASGSRPDLAGAYPGRGTAHGFQLTGIAVPPMGAVCVVARSVGGGGSTQLGCAFVP